MSLTYAYLFCAILAEVLGTAALKASDGFSRPWPSLLVVLGYGVAFFLLSLTLRQMQVGIAYAIWSGVGTVLISIAAVFLFGQRLDGLWMHVGTPDAIGEAEAAIGASIL